MIDAKTKNIAKDILQFLKRLRFKPTSFTKGDTIFFKFPLENVRDLDEMGYVSVSPGQISILQDYYLEELAEAAFLNLSRKLMSYMKKTYGISLPSPNRGHGLGSGVRGYLYLLPPSHKASDQLATRYVCDNLASNHPDLQLKQAADSDIFVAHVSGGRLELRRYNFIRTFGWQDFKMTGDKVMKNLNKASTKLIKAIKDLSGVIYEGDQESISLKPLYLSIDVSPKGRPIDISVMKQAIKAAGLKEMRGIMGGLRSKIAKLANDNPDGIRKHLVPLLKQAVETKTSREETFKLELGDTGITQWGGRGDEFTFYHPIENIGKRGKVVEVTSVGVGQSHTDNIAWGHTFLDKVKKVKGYKNVMKVWMAIQAEAVAKDPDRWVNGPHFSKKKGVDQSLPTPKAHMVKDIKGSDIYMNLNSKPISVSIKSHSKSLEQGNQTYWYNIHPRFKKRLQALAVEIASARGTAGLSKILDSNRIPYDHHIYMSPGWD